MGLMDWLLGKNAPQRAPNPSLPGESEFYVPGKPKGSCIRKWVVVSKPYDVLIGFGDTELGKLPKVSRQGREKTVGKNFCTFEVYNSGARYQLWCAKGWVEKHFCICGAEDGTYRTLNIALHAALMSMMPLISAVFLSKLQSINTGKPWVIRNPEGLFVADVTFTETTGGAIPLGSLFFDEERLEIVETTDTDPDTGTRFDPPAFIVHADAKGHSTVPGEEAVPADERTKIYELAGNLALLAGLRRQSGCPLMEHVLRKYGASSPDNTRLSQCKLRTVYFYLWCGRRTIFSYAKDYKHYGVLVHAYDERMRNAVNELCHGNWSQTDDVTKSLESCYATFDAAGARQDKPGWTYWLGTAVLDFINDGPWSVGVDPIEWMEAVYLPVKVLLAMHDASRPLFRQYLSFDPMLKQNLGQ